jgi:hypothetical protein
MKKKKKSKMDFGLILLICYLIFSFLLGYNLLRARDWVNMDCHKDTRTYAEEDLCNVMQKQEKEQRTVIENYVFTFEGMKFITSPFWAPIAGIGYIVAR